MNMSAAKFHDVLNSVEKECPAQILEDLKNACNSHGLGSILDSPEQLKKKQQQLAVVGRKRTARMCA